MTKVREQKKYELTNILLLEKQTLWVWLGEADNYVLLPSVSIIV